MLYFILKMLKLLKLFNILKMNDTAKTGESQCQETSSVSKACPNCAGSTRLDDKGSHSSLKILNELHRMYEDRLDRIARESKGDVVKLQNQTFRKWVNDLLEQNALLVRTVEELEVEATKRVTLLEQRINEENKKYNERENCDKLLELKLINDTLEKENLSKDVEITLLIDDIKEKERTILNLRNLLSATCVNSVESKIFRNAETMTSSDVQQWQCGLACKPRSSHCLDTVTQTDNVIEAYENKIALLQTQLQSHIKSDIVTNEQNVGTAEEIRGLQRHCYCLEEQYRSSLSRSQLKDDIIREMRYQLKQAKARLQPEYHSNAKYSHRLEDWISGDHPTLLKSSSSSEKDLSLSNHIKMKLICCNTEKGNFSEKLCDDDRRAGNSKSMKNSEDDFECLFPKVNHNEKTTPYIKRRNALKLSQPNSARSMSTDQINSVHLT